MLQFKYCEKLFCNGLPYPVVFDLFFNLLAMELILIEAHPVYEM
jgi:hypothetical protein